MKPTLFYEDFVRDPTPVPFGAVFAVARILPCHCPDCPGDGSKWVDQVDCLTCERRGWLYPDTPDWFPGWEDAPRRWREHCLVTWKAMGILIDS